MRVNICALQTISTECSAALLVLPNVTWIGADESKSNVLLDDLGYLLLAITQAGAFLNENAIAVGGHLGTFHIDDLEL